MDWGQLMPALCQIKLDTEGSGGTLPSVTQLKQDLSLPQASVFPFEMLTGPACDGGQRASLSSAGMLGWGVLLGDNV